MRKQPVGWGVWHIGSTRRKRRQKGGFLRQNTISRSTARAALGALAVKKKKKNVWWKDNFATADMRRQNILLRRRVTPQPTVLSG